MLNFVHRKLMQRERPVLRSSAITLKIKQNENKKTFSETNRQWSSDQKSGPNKQERNARMTDLEMKALAPSENIIADMLEKRNKGTEDCVLTSDIAHEIGMNTLDFNSFLIDQKILERRNHRLQPTAKYADKGYTKFRSQFKYSSRGALKEIVYPVWTPQGVEFLKKILKIEN